MSPLTPNGTVTLLFYGCLLTEYLVYGNIKTIFQASLTDRGDAINAERSCFREVLNIHTLKPFSFCFGREMSKYIQDLVLNKEINDIYHLKEHLEKITENEIHARPMA